MLSTMNFDPALTQGQTRREFVKALSASSLAALMTNEPRAWGNSNIDHPKATADCCIVLWCAGGMAAPETWDPKRYLPFEVGLPVDKILVPVQYRTLRHCFF